MILRFAPLLLGGIFILLMGAYGDGCRSEREVGTATCVACHDGFSGSDQSEFLDGPHFFMDCETCHGPGGDHVANAGRGGLFIDNPDTFGFLEGIADCADCHQSDYDGFLESRHAATEAASCIDCHDVHRPGGFPFDTEEGLPLNSAQYAESCAECHAAEVSDTAMSVHGQFEIATCATCHDMHIADTFPQSPEDNSLCLQCHQYNLPDDAAVDFHTGGFHPVDPTGSGASRCVGCHMLPHSAAGDILVSSDHSLFTVAPEVSNDAIEAGVVPVPPNTCGGVIGCHDPGVPGSGSPHDHTNTGQNSVFQVLYESIGDIP